VKYVAIAILCLLPLAYELGAAHVRPELAFAFGCGRFYAGNFDPADDPRDEHSKCYPYYKAWEKSEQWPRAR
jgi:hypothetical protein